MLPSCANQVSLNDRPARVLRLAVASQLFMVKRLGSVSLGIGKVRHQQLENDFEMRTAIVGRGLFLRLFFPFVKI
jgi:hypothetical protein